MPMREFYGWVAFFKIQNQEHRQASRSGRGRNEPLPGPGQPVDWRQRYLQMQIASAAHNARLKSEPDA